MSTFLNDNNGRAGAGAGAGAAQTNNHLLTLFEENTQYQSSYNIQTNTNTLRIFIMGHGGIYYDQYIVIPKKIHMAFYTNRSEILLVDNANNILNQIMNRVPIEIDHYLTPNMVMKNMGIRLKGFYKSIENKKLISIGYAGIITNQAFPTTFFNLEKSIFESYHIDLITDPEDPEKPLIINILPFRITTRPTTRPTTRSNTRPNTRPNTIVLRNAFIKNIRQIKIIHFGDNIFGIIYDNYHFIDILNGNYNSSILNLTDKGIIKNYLSDNHNININSPEFNITDQINQRMHNLSLHFHDNNIIDKSLLIENYEYNLYEVFNRIRNSDFYKTVPKNILCHNMICRSDIIPIPINNGAPRLRSTVSVLERRPSLEPNFRNQFSNTLQKFKNSIINVKLNNSIENKERIINKLRREYIRIMHFYETNYYITRDDMKFILEVIKMVRNHNSILTTLPQYQINI